MNVVIWSRVSSQEQRDGYSIDAQLRVCRETASKRGWKVVREFTTAESARRGADRVAFNEMFQWLRKNARQKKINAVLSHKLDRICRNMRDAVRMQELEDERGVKLSFVENHFGPGAAGALSFNVMAAVAQYYSDNLRSEVKKGLDERARQGWPTGRAPFGYQNTNSDRKEPVRAHPEKSKTVSRIFELFASGRFTFKALEDQLAKEGATFRPSQPRFSRTTLSYILNNRFYVGEIKRRDQYFPGRHRPLIDRITFEQCQDILHGRNRRMKSSQHAFAGGLFQCHYCGSAVTGEKIRRKLKDGSVRVHQYYRCANNSRADDHPQVRWKEADLEEAIIEDLGRLTVADTEQFDWLREALIAAFSNLTEHSRRQQGQLAKRQSELEGMESRLLNAYLAGSVEEAAFQEKTRELKREGASIEQSLANLNDSAVGSEKTALAVLDWSQSAAEFWSRSKISVKREILLTLSLNRTLTDVSLVTTKRKPFDVLAEGPISQERVANRI
jgi:site-specific DNA recombinase